MVRFQFKKGLRFRQLNHVWTLMRRTVTGKLQFERDDGEEQLALQDNEVYQRWMAREWLVDETSIGIGRDLMYLATPRDLRALPEKQRKEVERKLSYMRALMADAAETQRRISCSAVRLNPLIEKTAKQLDDEDPPQWQTAWRWWLRFKATGCASKLEDHRACNRRRTNAVHFSVFEEVVSEVFLTQQKQPGKAVVNGVLERFARMNKGLEDGHKLKPPSPAAIYRWLNKLVIVVVDQARLGKAHTEREHRLVLGSVKVKELLERVEIDHTPVDLLAVCELTRMMLGRPWLTLVIDRFSRMVLGFYISFHAPSAYSVLYALRMSILPKDELLAALKITDCP